MRRDVQAIVLILVGGAVLRITIGDTFLNYVQEPMRPWLLLSGGILVVLGVLALIDVLRKGRAADDEATPHDEPHEHDDGHGHGHGGPRAAWLLLLPVLRSGAELRSGAGRLTAVLPANSVLVFERV